MGEPREEVAAYCPTCGAAWTPGAAYCGVCGRAAEARPAVEPHGTGTPEAPQEPVSAEGDRSCAWCGAGNAADAEQCVQCGAAFPRPEQDAAMLKASAERIRAANDSIAAMQRQRARRGLGRLFDH